MGPLACESADPEASAITFDLSEGALEIEISEEQVNVVAFDIYFEFKTSFEGQSGVLFHALSPTDELLIELINGSMINVRLNDLELTASRDRLDQNSWHSLNVEWNLQNFALFLDKNSTSDELPTNHYRPLTFNKASIGAKNDFTDGYIGCLKDLWINGFEVDLHKEIGDGLLGVKPGCIGACDAEPCANQGKCIEMYRDFTCDCSDTAYQGPFCREDVSVR